MGFLFLSLFFFVGAVSATNYTVTPSDSIQSKIDSAHAGDTLNLATGTYNQYNIKVNKSLTIAGPTTTGTPTAVIDAQNQGRVFNITTDVNVTLKYLTIKNGNASTDTSTPFGGGILNNGTCTIVGCKINSNTADFGGGILNYGTCTVTGSNINSNTATHYGGGILNSGTCTVTGSNINSNTAIYYGGGIYTYYGTCTVTGSNIISNTATANGGGIYNYYGTCTMTSSNIISNTATANGGGIYNDYGTCNMTGSNINSNTAIYGGGIYNYYGTCTVTGSNMISNTATANGGGIYNYQGTCTVTSSNINSNTADYGGGIYNSDDSTCTVTDSTMNTNTAKKGGSIYNNYTCTVTGSNINSNTADYGGGIYNSDDSTCTVTGSTIKSNTATYGGGGIANAGTCIVTGSTIKSNTATTNGGGILNKGNCTVTECNFESNKANTSGNAIYTQNGDISNRIFHFNRFYDTNPGYEIYCDSGSVDAMFNWWGSNTNPLNKVYGTVDTSPWLVLKLTASPTLIGNSAKSNITADLRYDSIDGYHNPSNGYFPNSIPVKFSTTLGSITSPVSTVSGTAKATLTSGSTSGVADVFALLDDEIVATTVNIDAILPTITTIDPANNAVNVPRNKVITVTFNEPIKAGNMWIELYNTSGTKTLIPITTSISGNVLTINHAALLANGTKYTLAFHTGSVTDLAGNSLAGVAGYFTTSTDGTAPTVTSTDPTNNAVNVARNKAITVTFNEAIKAGTMWIELYNTVGTKTLIPITTSISGNVLTINHAALLANGTKYTLAFHTGSVTDLAGNSLAGVSRYFTTSTDGTAPTITTTDPANNAVNVPRNKVITVTFSEPVKAGNMWIELYNAVGTKTPIAITTSISGNVLTINHAALLATGTKYVLAFHTGSITDAAGNLVASAVRYFTTGTT